MVMPAILATYFGITRKEANLVDETTAFTIACRLVYFLTLEVAAVVDLSLPAEDLDLNTAVAF